MLAAMQDDEGSPMGTVSLSTTITKPEVQPFVSNASLASAPKFTQLNLQTTMKSASSGSVTSASLSPASNANTVQKLPGWSARHEVYESKGSNLSIVYEDGAKSDDSDPL